MFKARIQCFIAGILVTVLLIGTFAIATPQIHEVLFGVNVVVNGERIDFDDDMQPFIMDDRTFLPIRGIAEVLGVEVNWDNDTQTVYIGEMPEQISQNVEIGNIITFGNIQWYVLDLQNRKALLISENILERRQFHSEMIIATWEISDIRQWLNDEFYNRFTDEERAQIAETYLDNSATVRYNIITGGNNTIDKIFLLSRREFNQYSRDLFLYGTDIRLAQATGLWWLRSTGGFSYTGHMTIPHPPPTRTAAFVFPNGDWDWNVVTSNQGVRPAMWVYL